MHPELTKKKKKGSKIILLLWSCASRQKKKGQEYPLRGQGCTREMVWTHKAKLGPYRSPYSRKTFKPASHRTLELEGHKPLRNHAPSALKLREHFAIIA